MDLVKKRIIACIVLTAFIALPSIALAADYKMDGNILRKGSNKVAVLDGKTYRDASGNKKGELDGKFIRDAAGNSIAEINGDTIRVRGSNVGTMSDVRRAIDGPGGPSLAGFWVLFVR